MKHFLSGTAVAAALAFAAPVWAQAPSTQYPTGTPSSPPGTYTQQQTPSYGQQQTPSYGQQPAPSGPQGMPYAQQPTPSAPYAQRPSQMPGASAAGPDTSAESATEPMPGRRGMYRHSRHYAGHGRRVHRARYGRASGRGSTDNVANQLNRAELSQSGTGMAPSGYAPQGAPPQGYPRQGYPQQGGPRY